MSLQAALNDQAIKALGHDFTQWLAAQDSHHENQIKFKAVQHICDNKMPDTSPQSDF